jgi:hypothetical protein
MNCCDNEAKQGQKPSGLKGWTTGPRGKWLMVAMAVAAGLTLGWEQLVVLGIAPILLSLLPCLVMCGLGLCVMKCKDKPAGSADGQVDRIASSTAKEVRE